MDFKYLYNPDNGICHPYSAIVAANRSDLVPLLADELRLIGRMSVAEIIAQRVRLADPTVSVAVEADNAPIEAEKPQEAVSAASVAAGEGESETPQKAKGVSVVGKIEKPTEAEGEIQFEDKPKDYKGYCIYSGDIFPVEDLASVPDTELVRFASEVLKRNYEDAPAVATDIERADYYAALRSKIAKALTRINKKRIAKRAEKEAAKNGGND